MHCTFISSSTPISTIAQVLISWLHMSGLLCETLHVHLHERRNRFLACQRQIFSLEFCMALIVSMNGAFNMLTSQRTSVL